MPKKTPEVRAKDAIKMTIARICEVRGLRHKGVWHAGATFGVATLDYTGVIAGHPLVIEAKRFDTGGKLTARQQMDLDEYAAAGSAVFVIDGEQALKVFAHWLEHLSPRSPSH